MIDFPLFLLDFDHRLFELSMQEHDAILIIRILIFFFINELNVLKELLCLLLHLQLLLLFAGFHLSFQLLYPLFKPILLIHILGFILLPL